MSEPTIPAILGRPIRSPKGLGFEQLHRALEDVTDTAQRLREAGGGLVVLAYPEGWEAGALILLATLYARLQHRRHPAALWRPLLETEPPIGRGEPAFLLVH